MPRLYEHFAACDVAVVQGGGTSTLELTALRPPFVYFPLEGHAEQTLVVAKRLARQGAGRAAELIDRLLQTSEAVNDRRANYDYGYGWLDATGPSRRPASPGRAAREAGGAGSRSAGDQGSRPDQRVDPAAPISRNARPPIANTAVTSRLRVTLPS